MGPKYSMRSKLTVSTGCHKVALEIRFKFLLTNASQERTNKLGLLAPKCLKSSLEITM